MIPIVVLGLVLLLIAVRQLGPVKFQIWQVMAGGALAVLLSGSIRPLDALRAVNWEVMLFLFSMFLIGAALEESGYLARLAYLLFCRARTRDQLLLVILFGFGLLSALLMNDTLAIVGTPVVLLMAERHRINARALLIALAFAVTIGSAASPLGNPQNFLIATEAAISSPFVVFFRMLLIPTLLNLLVAFGMLKLFYREHFNNTVLNHCAEEISDSHLARLARLALILLAGLILIKIVAGLFSAGPEPKLVYITVIAALPILIFSPRRLELVRKVDWHTLIFFAAMFILMASVWQTGFFQSLIGQLELNLRSLPVIMVVSVLLSQLISNVPLVALYLPILLENGVSDRALMALAAGSTIAGNMLIMGAASNVIIIQNAERRSGETITLIDFARIGIPLTLLNGLVYLGFLYLF
ncbi:MAG: SLC13 family permease [candidate division WOR-3 bacterium]|uniref:Anion transporter n=1 Tax=candidate division WOR-3 bacterium TaxID=2052148 RepID=A0A7C3IUC8_UNCW3|nr:SLC13 family permease [candidate division WOR-3 bacterium]